MTTEDINKVTEAVIAQLKQGATDVDGIEPSTALTDTDNVLADSGSALKKLPVSLFKKIVASGAEAYRLVVSAQVYKATTTAVGVDVVKGSGGSVEQLTALPKGWKIKVHWEGAELSKDSIMGIGTLNPNELAGATSVTVTLYDGDPTVSVDGVLAQAIDTATLLLVADGKDGQDGAKGDKGDTGAAGEKGDKGDTGAKGGSEVLYDDSFYPGKNTTTDTTDFTDSYEVLQPTGYLDSYTDADGTQWSGVFTCESYPDWFAKADGACYPYGNGNTAAIPYLKTFSVDDSGRLTWNFSGTVIDATMPYFYHIQMCGVKKIDDTHFTVYEQKSSTKVWSNFDKTKLDCSKFAFGNPLIAPVYDVTGCKRVRVRIIGAQMTPNRYDGLVKGVSPFAMRGYANAQTLFCDNCAEYELGDSGRRCTRVAASSFYRTSYSAAPQQLSGDFAWTDTVVAYRVDLGDRLGFGKVGGKVFFCLNSIYNRNAPVAMGSRLIIEKLE